MKTRASSSEETSRSIDTNEIFTDSKEKEQVDCTCLWRRSHCCCLIIFHCCWCHQLCSAGNNTLPKVMELVGLWYTGWFSSRTELAEDIDSLKKKIAGTE
ncbi:hypothetical protein EUTSA_v10005327mg [Eutrema salsugineum]|uniref:Uncharacterized protein n=1 Tax=Eutrema salsugineum TaxID=72664 RepID=V4KNF6_EUTSA|nr:hypothetical protein EUTSA_v10005327mg [Eutrema salsugineum]